MSDLTFLTLSLRNFKNFASLEFDLNRKPGLFYITGANAVAPELGANGVGKTTIFDALTWVLFGKTGRDNRPANAVQPWDGAKPTQVSLLFSRNGEEFQLSRTRNPNRLEVGTRHTAEREIQQEEIPKLIGMSEEMFRRTLVLGQFGQLFLDLKPEAQAQMFTEALSLDVWLRAVEKASAAEKQAAKDFDQADRELIASQAILGSLTEQIGESEKQAALFETDKAARIAKIERGITTLQTDLEELNEHSIAQPKAPINTKAEATRAKLADEREGARVLAVDLRATTADLNQSMKRLEAFEQQLKRPKKTCAECGQEISDKEFKAKFKKVGEEIEALAEVAQGHKAEVDACAARVQKLEAQLQKDEDAFADAQEAYDRALNKWNDWNASVRATQAELQRQKGQLTSEKAAINIYAQSATTNKKRRADLREKGADLKAAKEDAQAHQEEAKFWVSAFREIRLSIIDSALIELEMAASRHAAMLGLNDWGIKFDTERETKAGQVSYGFSVSLYPPGEKEPVKWESYSGGESQRWSLAVSFGLSEVLLARAGLSPNVEVLDEPTRGLSSSGVMDLLDHLRDRALELNRAIYFVDHHSLDKGAFDQTLMVTKTAKGSSAKWL